MVPGLDNNTAAAVVEVWSEGTPEPVVVEVRDKQVEGQQVEELVVEAEIGETLLMEVEQFVANLVGLPAVPRIEVDIGMLQDMSVGKLFEGLAGSLVGNIVVVDPFGMQALVVHILVQVQPPGHTVVDNQVVPPVERGRSRVVGRPGPEAGGIDCHKGSILDLTFC